MLKKTPILLMIFILVLSGCTMAYRPEISGKLEQGNKLYTDFNDEKYMEEIEDRYHYQRYWFKYKQKLAPYEYYYFKLEYYQKEYQYQHNYDNVTTNLWGNYTYNINEKLKNRWEINIKDKNYNYTSYTEKSYQSYRLKYQLDYDFNQKNDYDIYLQRQWNNYLYRQNNDNTVDRLNIGWDYDVNEKLKVGTTFQIERQLFDYKSDSTNKYENKIAFDFKYKL